MRRIVLVSLLTVALVSCMREPGDGENVGVSMGLFDEVSQPITFDGFISYPSYPVTVYAYLPASQSWTKLGETQSSPAEYPMHWEGLTGYYWGLSIGVPRDAWPGCGFVSARVRALSGPYGGAQQLINSLVPDYSACWNDNPNWIDFGANCLGPNSPDAVIHGQKYCGGSGGSVTGIDPPASCDAEKTGETCTEGASRPAPCLFDVPKKWICEGTMDVCEFVGEGEESGFCIGGYDASDPRSAVCGLRSQQKCTAQTKCAAGSKCQFNGTEARCQKVTSCTVPDCYRASERAGLCVGDDQ